MYTATTIASAGCANRTEMPMDAMMSTTAMP